MYLRRLWMFLGALLLSISAPVLAHAQSTVCASWSPSTVDISASVNPFSPSTVNGNVTMTFHEGTLNPIAVFVYLHPHNPADTTVYSIIDTTNGNFQLVVPASTHPNGGPGTLAGDKLPFSPSNPTAPSVANWQFSIPASAFTTTAGVNTVSFDMELACKGTSDNRDDSDVMNGLVFSYTIASAMQASFAGTALDFGDISNVSNGAASGHTVNGQINVKSTGPYTVAVDTDHHFIMTPNDGTPTGTLAQIQAQEIGYSMTFLSQTASGNSVTGSTTFPSKACQSATLSGNTHLPISTTLTEGGSGKTSASYKDYINVTFTPLVTPYPALSSCP
jgi:hypothetical protein